MRDCPSIFNDVLSTITRGRPESRVVEGSRIGELIHQAAGPMVKSVIIKVDPDGAVASLPDDNLSKMALACGIMGVPITDHRALKWEKIAEGLGIEFTFKAEAFRSVHPNHYKIEIAVEPGHGRMIGIAESHVFDAISEKGGEVELIAIDGLPVSVKGDRDENIVFGKNEYRFKNTYPVGTCSEDDNDASIPFTTVSEMRNYNKEHGLELWQLALVYESARSGMSHEILLAMTGEIYEVMRESLKTGLALMHAEGKLPKDVPIGKSVIPGVAINEAITYINAISETIDAEEVYVAAPDQKSAACLPGTLFAVADALIPVDEALDFEDRGEYIKAEVVKALLAGGLIAVLNHCRDQDTARAITAAAVCQLAGGSAEDCVKAAGYADANVLAGMSAISAVNATFADFGTAAPNGQRVCADEDFESDINWRERRRAFDEECRQKLAREYPENESRSTSDEEDYSGLDSILF